MEKKIKRFQSKKLLESVNLTNFLISPYLTMIIINELHEMMGEIISNNICSINCC